MSDDDLKVLARQLLDGQLSIDAFLGGLSRLQTADLDEAQVDLDRPRRCGLPEVIYADGKSIGTMAKIISRQLEVGNDVFATRVERDKATALVEKFPSARYNVAARTLRVAPPQPSGATPARGNVAVVAAGSSDLPVAEEARETADWAGSDVSMICDVGVAGPQRLQPHLPALRRADAIVVVAGMEGALPSVVGGHVACPVIAVPTSVGYGANFGGITALLAMLNSCASNVSVVNIDAGFKGGYVAGLIARRSAAARSAAGSTERSAESKR
jgi:NCAIR mutase (PurE)-related protein